MFTCNIFKKKTKEKNKRNFEDTVSSSLPARCDQLRIKKDLIKQTPHISLREN